MFWLDSIKICQNCRVQFEDLPVTLPQLKFEGGRGGDRGGRGGEGDGAARSLHILDLAQGRKSRKLVPKFI